MRLGLITLTAPSGTGKSTLCKKLLQVQAHRLCHSVSTTSRAPRGQEKEGVDYFFVSEPEFRAKIQEGEFVEWAFVHGNYYGTSKTFIESVWSSGRHVLLDIDVQGALTLKSAYGARCETFFLAPPSFEELERRLRARGTETEEKIQLRLQNALGEIAKQHLFSQVIINDDLDSAYSVLEAAIVKKVSAWERESNV